MQRRPFLVEVVICSDSPGWSRPQYPQQPDYRDVTGVRVSAVIGAFNSAATLRRAMESMLDQAVADLELIVVDDGSTDDSVAVARTVDDQRVRVLEMGRNAGIATSLNAAVAQARAPVVAVLDADDHARPDRLEHQLAALDADAAIAVVGSRMLEVDAAGRTLAPRTRFASGVVNDVLMRFNPIPNSSAAFRRSAVLEIGGYDPRYRYASEYDLWLRLAERHALVALDEALSTRVMGGANVAARAEGAQTREVVAIRARALRRRRTLRGASGLLAPVTSLLTPTPLKRARRRRLGQSP